MLWGLLGFSPARVGSRLASEDRGDPVYSSSRQRCRESWLSAWPLRQGWGRSGQGAQARIPMVGHRNQPMQSLHPNHMGALLREEHQPLPEKLSLARGWQT